MRYLSLVACAVMLFPLSVDAAPPSFSDVHFLQPYASAIGYVQEQGIVGGYGDGTYRAAAPVNRAEFTKILVGATQDRGSIDSCLGEGIPSLRDIEAGAWYAPYVCAAMRSGSISGYPDKTFRPDRTISLAEASKILVASMNVELPPDNDPALADWRKAKNLKTNPFWWQPFVEALRRRGTIPPTARTPEHLLTRGEMAEMIYHLKTGRTSEGDITTVAQPAHVTQEVIATLPTVADSRVFAFSLDHRQVAYTWTDPEVRARVHEQYGNLYKRFLAKELTREEYEKQQNDLSGIPDQHLYVNGKEIGVYTEIHHVQFSRDGKRMAFDVQRDQPMQGYIVLDGRQLQTHMLISNWDFSPSGKLVYQAVDGTSHENERLTTYVEGEPVKDTCASSPVTYGTDVIAYMAVTCGEQPEAFVVVNGQEGKRHRLSTPVTNYHLSVSPPVVLATGEVAYTVEENGDGILMVGGEERARYPGGTVRNIQHNRDGTVVGYIVSVPDASQPGLREEFVVINGQQGKRYRSIGKLVGSAGGKHIAYEAWTREDRYGQQDYFIVADGTEMPAGDGGKIQDLKILTDGTVVYARSGDTGDTLGIGGREYLLPYRFTYPSGHSPLFLNPERTNFSYVLSDNSPLNPYSDGESAWKYYAIIDNAIRSPAYPWILGFSYIPDGSSTVFAAIDTKASTERRITGNKEGPMFDETYPPFIDEDEGTATYGARKGKDILRVIQRMR